MSIFNEQTIDSWWRHLRTRFIVVYFLVALLVLVLSALGHVWLLGDIGKTFGGFFWEVDNDNHIVVASTAAQLPDFGIAVGSISTQDYISRAQISDPQAPGGTRTFTGPDALTQVYERVSPNTPITYSIANQNGQEIGKVTRSAVTFTLSMWLQNYGIALAAGLSWLIVGSVLMLKAHVWVEAVEGITLLPPAILFLLYSHLGNVQRFSRADLVFQFIWIPAFALLGSAFIHLSLTYRPEALSATRIYRFAVDGLPYLPLIALLAFDISSFLIYGAVPTRPNVIFALGYGALGGLLSLGIGLTSLLRVIRVLPVERRVPEHIRHRLVDLLTLWIGGVGLGFCLGVLPILLTGRPLLPLSMFYLLATLYPFLLWYALRSLRLIDRLQLTLNQREKALVEQRKTAKELRQANQELQRATSLLLHADAHLRSLLSQRIHDQPKQQALRIRSLLGYWQHKLKVEADHDATGMIPAYPLLDALGKVRKISEELESDLRGLQLLVEDVYQRRSLGLRLHLEKLIREDLPALHPESPLKVQADLWVLDGLDRDLEQTPEGERIAEAISYAVTQALLNIYNHAGASYATARALLVDGYLEIYVIDDGHGFNEAEVSPERTSLFKARLKAREAGGSLDIHSVPRPLPQHGTTVVLRVPFAVTEGSVTTYEPTG